MTDGTVKSRSSLRRKLSKRYLAALRSHLASRSEVNGDIARAFGRAALASGMAPLDLAYMHERALTVLARSFDLTNPHSRLFKRKGHFLTQALIPLEEDHRTTREAIRHLHHHNKTLRVHAAALTAGNRRLEREIARRKASEESVRQGQERYRVLLQESHLMQKKLRLLTRQIIITQEEERKEISRELHDEVVQTLVGINVELSALAKGAAVGVRALKAKIVRTQRLVENSVNAVHRFARELRPAVLDDLGLIPAIHAYSRNLATRKKLKIQLTAFGGVEALGSAKRTVLFRVAQEALTNVARHAHATKVRMSIAEVSGTIRMEISDNGKSFSVSKTLQAGNPKRLGLVGMRERLEMVGGSLTIDSAPGKGTTVRAEIPFTQEPATK